jgi:hypothetical protein
MNPIEICDLYRARVCEDGSCRTEMLCAPEVKQIASIQTLYPGRFSVAKNAMRAG